MTDIKLCECECGAPAPIAKWSDPRVGSIKGQPTRFIQGHNGKGSKHSPEAKAKISAAKTGTTQTLEHRINRVSSFTGKEPIFSPILPGKVFINFSKSGNRWYARAKRNNKITNVPHALAVYEFFFGTPPNGFVVHHINGESTLLQNDNPKNLLAVPAVWNRSFFPMLARGYHIQEADITKAYIKYYKKLADVALFDAVCHELYKNNKKDKKNVERKNQKSKLDSM